MAIPTTSSRRPLRAAVLLLAVAAALLLLTAPHASAAAGGLPGGLLPPPLLAAQSHDSILGSSTSGEGGSSSSGSSMGRQLQQAGYTVTGSVKTARRSFSYKAARQGLRHGRRSQHGAAWAAWVPCSWVALAGGAGRRGAAASGSSGVGLRGGLPLYPSMFTDEGACSTV
eukprot:XP_001695581.1 predicted protein [Chlamydomonas reinhardtii]